MRRTLLFASAGIIVLLGFAMMLGVNSSQAQPKEGKMLSHDVYFTLKDNSPEAKARLVAACKKYLTKHEGEVFFTAGVLAEALKREVNDLKFDVALHIVFKDLESQEKYQKAKRHDEFIAENKDNWKSVRVFDSIVER
jgi:Stress responsive A/B Barrel Domain